MTDVKVGGNFSGWKIQILCPEMVNGTAMPPQSLGWIADITGSSVDIH